MSSACTRHTFISLAIAEGEDPKGIAEQRGTSVQMIEKHSGKYMRPDFGERLIAAPARKSEISSEMESTPNFEPVGFPLKAVASPTGFEPVLPA